MKARTAKYYDWSEDIQPVLFKNLCASLKSQGIDCPKDFHGGCFEDGKWVGNKDYRNYWHVYIDYWGEYIRNDSYVMTYFPPNEVEEWDQIRFKAIKKYGAWAIDLIDAVHKMLVDHKFYNKHGEASILIWFSW